MSWLLYRSVRANAATVEDFTSNAAKGKPIPQNLPPDLHWLWDGLSMYETVQQAERSASRNPRLGAFVAAVKLPDDGRFHVLRTTASEGHHTVWGIPGELLQCVIHIQPISRVPPLR